MREVTADRATNCMQMWQSFINMDSINRIQYKRYDRCMCGLTNQNGDHVLQRSVLFASHSVLLEPFDSLLCSGHHDHSDNISLHSQVWT